MAASKIISKAASVWNTIKKIFYKKDADWFKKNVETITYYKNDHTVLTKFTLNKLLNYSDAHQMDVSNYLRIKDSLPEEKRNEYIKEAQKVKNRGFYMNIQPYYRR